MDRTEATVERLSTKDSFASYLLNASGKTKKINRKGILEHSELNMSQKDKHVHSLRKARASLLYLYHLPGSGKGISHLRV